ncbi:MAG: 23S rRNA (guanosine(2251)-2'-O)-methyltransferase RlmB [Oscillospiraceae bacterium]|nr:23S rRNA (guanosine(2251)-2'-O)-methyltransferase RlmB [Oscillospiraceae bacterium]
MKNNRDSFRPGKKPFTKDSGFKTNKSGDFKRNERNFNRSKSNDSNKPYIKDDSRGKSNYSSNRSNSSGYSGYSSYSKNNGGGFNRFNKSDRPDKFDKPDRFNNFNKSAPNDKKPPFKKFDRKFDKPDSFKKFDSRDNRGERKSQSNVGGFSPRFQKGDANTNKKPDKFEKSEKDINIIVSSVEQEDSGMVYGRNAVIELIKSDKPIDKLFVQSGQREGSITMIFAEAVKRSIPIIEVEKVKLDSMINNSAHQGVIALASEKEYCSVDDILQIAEDRNEKPFILIADKIMDPHNLGAIIRTAECAGVHGIIIPKRHAAGVSPIVAKTSAGASVHMAIAKVANIANTIEDLREKGVWVFSSFLDLNDSSESENNEKKAQKEIKDYDDVNYDIPLALVVGNEGEGLSPIVIQKSDFLINIPMSGKIESLNVSCASAVLMYEVARQRKSKNK